MKPTEIFSRATDVDSKLASMDLSRAQLVEVVRRAVGAFRDSTPHDPANAPGTFSYIFGTRALREIHVGKTWTVDRRDSVEGIRHEQLGIKIVFQNVDGACDDNRLPRPRSPKGAGSERACASNQGVFSFDMPHLAPAAVDGTSAYYLMVAIDGSRVRAELSRPVVRDQTFSAFLERIYIVSDDELEETVRARTDDPDFDALEVEVVRK